MSDIKLFRTGPDGVQELAGTSVAVEKSLQLLIEKNLEPFLGVRFLASEYATGKKHGGRIDTLGIDENDSPVIIEYKRALNENVISQGLFYLDWLMDHKGEFTLLVQKRCGHAAAESIEWSVPRLLLVAGDFTKYDEYAIQQIPRNIELIRYRRYGDDFLLLELVNATTAEDHGQLAQRRPGTAKPEPPVSVASPHDESEGRLVLMRLDKASPATKDLFEALKAFLFALGDDVQMRVLDRYIAFTRIRNFLAIKPRPQRDLLLLYVNVDPDSIELEDGFTRDMRQIGHQGGGKLEITVASDEALERAKPLIIRSYEIS